MITTGTVAAIAATLVAALGAWTDARTGRIPNAITLPALGLALIAHGIAGGADALLTAALGTVAAGLVPYLLFRKGAMGGGDVKLFAALGAMLGPSAGVEAQWWAFVVGMLYVLGRQAYEGTLGRMLMRTARVAVRAVVRSDEEREDETRTSVRLGPAILCGLVLALVT
ncbi:A24 family peptidase [Sandaracinus amylolyticus]|uniref:A24 family peptidase n=1 Tax=Sandaracinus amylolyticus TaxID=927083 RepID=UPI001F29F959|nr:A24 family peptidase [Sandaracinus amylolyticus]UJR83801.1 Hypothetical protein I5071_58720 [Sandaracinus amylolyticus]